MKRGRDRGLSRPSPAGRLTPQFVWRFRRARRSLSVSILVYPDLFGSKFDSNGPDLLSSQGIGDAAECDVEDAAPPPPPRKLQRHRKGLLGDGNRSAYPLDPHLGRRLPTFHDEPKLFGGPFCEGKMLATVRAVFGMSSLAAAGSTATGTLRSIPSRQARSASMSSGVKSI
jgi:hypothetical protein